MHPRPTDTKTNFPRAKKRLIFKLFVLPIIAALALSSEKAKMDQNRVSTSFV